MKSVKNLCVYGIMSSIVACGTAETSRPDKTVGLTSPGAPVPEQNLSQNPVQSNGTSPVVVPVLAAVPVAVSFSRYVAQIPGAVDCIDQFVGSGYPDAALIENAIERTTSSKNVNIVAIGDYNPTAVPVLNVINLDQCNSDIDLRLFNPNGYYCIVRTKSWNSHVRIQRNCAAKLIIRYSEDVQTIQPVIPFWMKFFQPTTATTSSGISSQPEEMPCIP
jgi:hypothetical protein